MEQDRHYSPKNLVHTVNLVYVNVESIPLFAADRKHINVLQTYQMSVLVWMVPIAFMHNNSFHLNMADHGDKNY